MIDSTLDTEYLKGVLGDNNYQRLLSFYNYGTGWNGKGSRPIGNSSVLLMQDYFRKFYPITYNAPDSKTNSMSIFMSNDGNMILNWKDNKDNLQELEFLFDRKTIESYDYQRDRSVRLDINFDNIPRYYPITTPKLTFTHEVIGEYYDNWVNFLSKQNG